MDEAGRPELGWPPERTARIGEPPGTRDFANDNPFCLPTAVACKLLRAGSSVSWNESCAFVWRLMCHWRDSPTLWLRQPRRLSDYPTVTAFAIDVFPPTLGRLYMNGEASQSNGSCYRYSDTRSWSETCNSSSPFRKKRNCILVRDDSSPQLFNVSSLTSPGDLRS